MKRTARCRHAALLLAAVFLLGSSCKPDPPAVSAPPPGLASVTDTFLGPPDFLGDLLTTAPADRGYEAYYDGYLSFSNLPTAAVEALLPDGFRLAERIDGADGHPVIVMAGDQMDGAYFSPYSFYPSGVDYKEIMLLVPFVQRDASDDWFTYAVRMYLDYLWAVTFGNSNFGYEKELAYLEFPDPTRRATQFSSPMLSGDFTSVGASYAIADARVALKNLDAMLEIMSTSVLGVFPDKDGLLQFCSHFEWHFPATAKVTAAKAKVEIKGELRPDMKSWVGWTFESVDDGAVYVAGMRWRLANPPAMCPWWPSLKP